MGAVKHVLDIQQVDIDQLSQHPDNVLVWPGADSRATVLASASTGRVLDLDWRQVGSGLWRDPSHCCARALENGTDSPLGLRAPSWTNTGWFGPGPFMQKPGVLLSRAPRACYSQGKPEAGCWQRRRVAGDANSLSERSRFAVAKSFCVRRKVQSVS